MAKKAFRHRVLVNGVVTYESDSRLHCVYYRDRLPEQDIFWRSEFQFRYRIVSPIGKCFVYAADETDAMIAGVQRLYGKTSYLLDAEAENDGPRRWRFIGRMGTFKIQPEIHPGGPSDHVMTVLPEWIHINVREL